MNHRSTEPRSMEDLLDEAFPLIAEDFREARMILGITPKMAASRAGIDPALYLALEEGSLAKSRENVNVTVSVAKRLGLKEVRFCYVEEVQKQYMKVDLSADGPLTVFLDTLRHDVRELEEQSVFVNSHQVLDLVERIGFSEIFGSRKRADKQLVELWIAAVFTLCLRRTQDYYVGLIKDNAPDVEVLGFEGSSGKMMRIKLEITQHGIHSRGLTDVIGKKLRKKYAEGTVVVVFVEQAEEIPIGELDEFIRANNTFDQQIFILGGSQTPGSFKLVPWEQVTPSSYGEIEWMETDVSAKEASKGYRGYDGVVFKPKGSWFLPLHPVFVKELALHRQM